MVRVAFGSHGREKAVQLAIWVIFDIVPHFKTQVGASILQTGNVGLCKSLLIVEVGVYDSQGPLLDSFKLVNEEARKVSSPDNRRVF